jgi:molybdopterin-guanine dinucleotide biosynthesis protein A
MKTICVILAGGRSSRMGRDKAELPIHGKTFLGRLVAEYQKDFPVMVSVGEHGKFDTCGADELVDLHPGQGPLAGLETAFAETDAEAIFLTATDLPFGRAELAKKLCDILGNDDACIIKRQDGHTEVAFGVYHRRCQQPLAEYLESGGRAVKGLLDKVRVRWVFECELSEFPLEQLLQNVNTPEEYEKALRQENCGVTANGL